MAALIHKEYLDPKVDTVGRWVTGSIEVGASGALSLSGFSASLGGFVGGYQK